MHVSSYSVSMRTARPLWMYNTKSTANPIKYTSPLFSDEEVGFEQYRVAEKAHGSWMKLYLEGNTSEVLTNMGKKVLKQYLEALAAMSSALSKQLGKYDMYSMIAGMVFVFQVSRKEFHSSLVL